MGSGIHFICNDCGRVYECSTGIGFAFPKQYKKLLDSVKKGKYGKEWKELVLNTRNIAIDAKTRLFICDKCSKWKTEEGLSLYVTKEGNQTEENREFDYSNASYVTDFDLENYYTLLKEYDHICPKCKNIMRLGLEDEEDDLPCPKCGGKNYSIEYISWD